MEQKIMTSESGTNYIVFGDDDRRYELLESVGNNTVNHDFELRVDNSPNDIIAEFSVIVPQPVQLTEHGNYLVNASANFRTSEQIYMVKSADENGNVDVSASEQGTVFMYISESDIASTQKVSNDQIFIKGLEQAQVQVASMIENEPEGAGKDGLRHLQNCITVITADLKESSQEDVDAFTHAVEQMDTQDMPMTR